MQEKELWETVYINNTPRHAIFFGDLLLVDHPTKMYQRAERHRFTPAHMRSLKSGSRVYANGNWYSLGPD